MNENIEIVNADENISSSNNEEYAPKKSQTINFLIGIVCLFLAFVFWCGAHYAADPMVELKMPVKFVLVGGAANEELVYEPISLVFYGKESYFESHEVIEIKFERKHFDSYDTDTVFNIEKNDDYHTHTKKVTLKLIETETTPK